MYVDWENSALVKGSYSEFRAPDLLAGFFQVCLKGSAGEERIIVIISTIESAHLEEEAMQLSLSNGCNPDLQRIEVERPKPSKIATWFNSITRKMKKGLLRFLDIISTKPYVQ